MCSPARASSTVAPAEVVATLLDEGHYLCSERTMYRILAADQPVRERRNQREHPQYTKPELVATAPNQTWSWDITKLLGPTKWTYFYLYVVLDIFSRYAVGWMVDPEGPSLISLAVAHFLLSGRASGHTVLSVLLEENHRQQVGAGPAPGRRVERRRRLADLLATPAGELLAHRLDDLPLARDHTSSVSVMSSPIFDSLSEPQHAQDVGGGTTFRSRGICAGNGLRAGLRRVNPWTCVVSAAAFSDASSSSVALASSLSSWSLSWSRRRCLRSERCPKNSRRSFSMVSFRKAISASASDTFAAATAARASASVAFASAFRSLGLRLGSLALGRHEGRLQCRDIGPACHRRDRITALDSPLQQSSRVSRFAADQPARDGRQLWAGFRQSIPSSR